MVRMVIRSVTEDFYSFVIKEDNALKDLDYLVTIDR